jgi:23S rRNA (uridine2552-2'-O)-methyltransferase
VKKQVRNRKLKQSSKNWIRRQINDPYVIKAKNEGYRSRAAFKLIEIQNKFNIIKRDSIVVDLGASPGSWSQVAIEICGNVMAIDLLDMRPISGVSFIKVDFLEEGSFQKMAEMLRNRRADVILSDMAPNTCGITKIDHIKIVNLVEKVYEFCEVFLNVGGNLVTKVFHGGTESTLLNELKKQFTKVKHFKPRSSRKESSEIYLVATMYRPAGRNV